MRIAVIGTGYVGLVTGACFAQMGNDVVCVDVDELKIQKLCNGVIPIYEPGLEQMVVENYQEGRLKFTTDIAWALNSATIVFIAVGTPMGEDGSADLRYVLQVAKSIGEHIKHYTVIVDKSTVPIGTADKVVDTVREVLGVRGENIEFAVVSNPEFLKEGAAIEDFMKPDRVVVGANDEKAMELMRELYAPFTRSYDRFIAMDVRSAEMTKYAANAMLATKISFINEIAAICERVGADVNKVRVGIGSDSRIGYSFIYPGCGYGGSCFPKDVKALEKIALQVGYEPKILKAVESVNAAQKEVLGQKVVNRFGENLQGLVFAVWGLAFKPETDDMREASSVALIKRLLGHGARVKIYDPKAMVEAKEHYLHGIKNIEYCSSKYEAVRGVDALCLVTEWKEFRSPDFEELMRSMKTPVIFDGRNQYKSEKLALLGFEYYQIGVKS